MSWMDPLPEDSPLRDGSSMERAIIRIRPPNERICWSLAKDGKWYHNPFNHPPEEPNALKLLEEVADKKYDR